MKMIINFFLQPVTWRATAADAAAMGGALRALAKLLLDLTPALLKLSLLMAGAALLLAHVPALAMLCMAGLAISNGRFFSTILCLMLALAWFHWLWRITPV